MSNTMMIQYKESTIILSEEIAEIMFKMVKYLPCTIHNSNVIVNDKILCNSSETDSDCEDTYINNTEVDSENDFEYTNSLFGYNNQYSNKLSVKPIVVSVYALCSNNNDRRMDKQCVISIIFDDRLELSNITKSVTDNNASNTRTDMHAIIIAISNINNKCSKPQTVTIYSVSESVVNILINNMSGKKNNDLWNIIFDLLQNSKHIFIFKHARNGECELVKSMCKSKPI